MAQVEVSFRKRFDLSLPPYLINPNAQVEVPFRNVPNDEQYVFRARAGNNLGAPPLLLAGLLRPCRALDAAALVLAGEGAACGSAGRRPNRLPPGSAARLRRTVPPC